MSHCKLVFFVPQADAEAVKLAVFEAGAGRIGNYERCAWQVEGTGQFLGGAGTQPVIGESGRLESVTELRVETVCPTQHVGAVVAALRAAHPYEEPAFDLYPLLDPPA